MTRAVRIPNTAPNGRRVVAAVAMQAVLVGIDQFTDDGIEPDFSKIKPLGEPTPVRDPAGYMMFQDEGGEHWSANELAAGKRDDNALHHRFNELKQRLLN